MPSKEKTEASGWSERREERERREGEEGEQKKGTTGRKEKGEGRE